MVGMFGVVVFALFVLHFFFVFQFRTALPEVLISFAVRALSAFVRVNTIEQQVAIACRRRCHCGHR